MALPSLSVKTRDAYGVTYAAPSAPSLTVRFKTNSSLKTLSGKSVSNNLSEVIYNDLNEITVGTETVNDPISIRLRVSGSLDSVARIQEVLADIAANLTTWETENVFIGFEPVTAPGLTV